MTETEINQELQKYIDSATERGSLLTVFMTTGNRAKYLPKAIDSVLNQTLRDYEFVILDNLSKDETPQIVERYRLEGKNIRFISRPSVVGDTNFLFAIRNIATKYAVVLHDDDIVEPEYLDIAIREMEEHGYDFLSVRCTTIDENDDVIKQAVCRDATEASPQGDLVWHGDEYFKQYFSKDCDGMIFPATVYRASFMKEHAEEFEKYNDDTQGMPCGDQLLWFWAGDNGGTICKLNKPLIRYRIHAHQDSSVSAGFMEMEMYDYCLRTPRYREYLFSDEIRPETAYRISCYYVKMRNNYAHRVIDGEKFKRFWKYECVQLLKSFADTGATYRGLRSRFVRDYLFYKFKKI